MAASSRASEKVFEGVLRLYRGTLHWVLDHPTLTLIVLFLTIALNVVVIIKIPKGFFPVEDTGAISGSVRGPQDSSFPAMNNSVQQIIDVIKNDPAVANVTGFCWRRWGHQYRLLYIALKPLAAAQRQCLSDHRPPAPQIEPSAGGFSVSPSRAGSAHRRPVR